MRSRGERTSPSLHSSHMQVKGVLGTSERNAELGITFQCSQNPSYESVKRFVRQAASQEA